MSVEPLEELVTGYSAAAECGQSAHLGVAACSCQSGAVLVEVLTHLVILFHDLAGNEYVVGKSAGTFVAGSQRVVEVLVTQTQQVESYEVVDLRLEHVLVLPSLYTAEDLVDSLFLPLHVSLGHTNDDYLEVDLAELVLLGNVRIVHVLGQVAELAFRIGEELKHGQLDVAAPHVELSVSEVSDLVVLGQEVDGVSISIPGGEVQRVGLDVPLRNELVGSTYAVGGQYARTRPGVETNCYSAANAQGSRRTLHAAEDTSDRRSGAFAAEPVSACAESTGAEELAVRKYPLGSEHVLGSNSHEAGGRSECYPGSGTGKSGGGASYTCHVDVEASLHGLDLYYSADGVGLYDNILISFVEFHLLHALHVYLQGVIVADVTHYRPECCSGLEVDIVLVADLNDGLYFRGAARHDNRARHRGLDIVRSEVSGGLGIDNSVGFAHRDVLGDVILTYDQL